MKVPALRHLFGYVAVLVLVGAGSAQALSGTGTVDSGDIKNGQVKRIDIAANAINSTKVANNSLTGADINEGSLAKVPNADKVDGLNTGKFTRTYTAAGTTARTLVASVGGLQVWAGCLEDSDPIDHYADIRVRSTVAGAKLTSSRTIGTSAQTSYTSNFGVGVEHLLGGTLITGHADLLFSTPAGAVVEAHIDWAGLAEAGSNTCVMHGTLFGG